MTVTSPLVEARPQSHRPTGMAVPRAAWTPPARGLLIPELQELLERLHRELEPERAALLAAREARRLRWSRGERRLAMADDELPEARGDWSVAPLPSDLTRRRVEITGPACDAAGVLDQLSRSEDGARADAARLDLEDSMKPSWSNVVRGLVHLVGAVHGTLSSGPSAEAGPRVSLHDRPLIVVRGRGLHLVESNVQVDGEPISAALFDLACTTYWTARTLLDQGRTPAFYVPKCEHHLEARWWSRALARLEEELDLPRRSVKATFEIETLPAAGQIEEILYQARDHAAGLKLGRWDRILSDLETPGTRPDRPQAHRATPDPSRDWLHDHALRLIAVCHRHGALAIGTTNDAEPAGTAQRRAEQAAAVREEKSRESALGFDGATVSHPRFVTPALEAFSRPHQLDVVPALSGRPDPIPEECRPPTISGLRADLRVAIVFLHAWNEGSSFAVCDERRVDLSGFEAARTQVGQRLRHRAVLDDGEPVTRSLIRRLLEEELARIELAQLEAGADVHTIESYRKARVDLEAVLVEPVPRPFLATASEPVDLTVDQCRALLRAGASADPRPGDPTSTSGP